MTEQEQSPAVDEGVSEDAPIVSDDAAPNVGTGEGGDTEAESTGDDNATGSSS